jgi:hypothetical protein
MSIRFSAAVSLLALACAATPAFADPSGFVSGSLGLGQFTFDPFPTAPLHAANLRGTIQVELGSGMSAQVDAVLDRAIVGNALEQVAEYALGGALHLTHRPNENLLVGGIVQYDGYTAFEVGDDPIYVRSSRAVVGAEVQYFLDRVTLYAQGGAIAYLYPGEEFDQFGYFGTAQVRYFLNDDLRVDLHGIASHTENVGSSLYGTTSIGAGIGLEYRLPDNPVSLFASADIYRFSAQSSSNVRTDARLMVGLKFNFGSGTLFERDRNGPSLDPVAQYPFIANGPV